MYGFSTGLTSIASPYACIDQLPVVAPTAARQVDAEALSADMEASSLPRRGKGPPAGHVRVLGRVGGDREAVRVRRPASGGRADRGAAVDRGGVVGRHGGVGVTAIGGDRNHAADRKARRVKRAKDRD